MIMKNELTQDSKPEFIGQIIDLFEDYLADKEITLENEERDEAIAEGEYEDPEEAAIIYGSSYDIIGDTVSDIIETYDLMNKQFDNAENVESVVKDIMQSFHDVLKEGEYTENIPETDIKGLEDDVRDTFKHWGLYP